MWNLEDKKISGTSILYPFAGCSRTCRSRRSWSWWTRRTWATCWRSARSCANSGGNIQINLFYIYINNNFPFRGSGRALVKATDLCTVEQVQAAVDRYVSTALSTGWLWWSDRWVGLTQMGDVPPFRLGWTVDYLSNSLSAKVNSSNTSQPNLADRPPESPCIEIFQFHSFIIEHSKSRNGNTIKLSF